MALAYAIPTGSKQPPAALVYANIPFKGFKLESAKRLDDPISEPSPQLTEVLEAWKRFGMDLAQRLRMEPAYMEKAYPVALNAVSGIHCSAVTLGAFIIYLNKFQDQERFSEKTGYFISALINCGADEHYTIQTTHLEREIDYLGMLNDGKHIVVFGAVGKYAGHSMRGGSLTIHGNAGGWVGYDMCGGDLTVHGDTTWRPAERVSGGNLYILGSAGDWAGYQMNGGRIFVYGNVGKFVGYEMKDGNIMVRGNTGDNPGCSMEGGCIHIYQNTGNHPGLEMKGGVMIIEGHIFPTIGAAGYEMTKGRIYVRSVGLEVINGGHFLEDRPRLAWLRADTADKIVGCD